MNKVKPEYEVQSEEARIRREGEEQSILTGVIEYAKERYAICRDCEAFSNIIKVCGECYCFMPAKVLLKDMECPAGKWGKLSD
jgi:hypothetical protein